MHYLITGHTGFKGSWLALWLAQRGHTVSGLALDPVSGSLFEAASVASGLTHDLRVDIRDAGATLASVRKISPDVVFHLAAQPLVRESYRDPRFTFETNVMGTLNVLEAVSQTPSVKALVVITTDKVYKNIDQVEGYVESDSLGGDDPYSSSKAMADLLTQSWVKSFPGVPTAVARGGNVIGGGDVSKDRLLPDLFESFASGAVTSIRNPGAVRPWQHVLDCLNGYIVLSEALLAGQGAGEWNIGPGRESFVSVGEVADLAVKYWGGTASWTKDEGTHPHEANLLALDASKAAAGLNWENKLPFPQSLEWAVHWNTDVVSGVNQREATLRQIEAFESLSSD